MDKELARLKKLLERYESGKVTAYEEAPSGTLTKDVTPERIGSLRRRIADRESMLSRSAKL